MIVRARSGGTLTMERSAQQATAEAARRHKAKKKPHPRRHLVTTVAAGAANAVVNTVSSPTTTQPTAPSTTTAAPRLTWAATAVPTNAERHLLNRFTFGFTPDEFARLRSRGSASDWFEQQLQPDTIKDPVLDAILAALPDLFLAPVDLAAVANSGRKPPHYIQRQHVAATVARRVYSTRQLQAVMEDFWTNHFYIPCLAANTVYYHADYVRTLRELSLTSFEELLLAAEFHPAMLSYLSTVNSDRQHPNENQARELFELHTVGRVGGYSEDTVGQVSRLLTGWTSTNWQVDYRPENHLTGTVSALDWSDPNADADGRPAFRSLLRYLAHHPKTAEFVCTKLAVRFVGDTPSDALVSGLTQTYLNNDTQIAPVLRAIVRHPEFLRSANQKLRTPADDCVASLRATGVLVAPMPALGVDDTTSFIGLAGLPEYAGNGLFTHLAPDGVPQVASAWSTSVRATAMLQWHWGLADPGSHCIGSDATRPSVASLLPRSSMRFDQWVDHLSRTVLGLAADDNQMAAACALTGLTNSSTVTATSAVATTDFPKLLVSLLDTPSLLYR